MVRSHSDADALALRAVNDDAAMEQLYRDHNDALWRELMRLTDLDVHLSNDLASQTWLRIYETLTTFDPDRAGFLTWAITIARSRHLDACREDGMRQKHAVVGREEVREPHNPADVTVDNDATRALLERVRALLPENQAQAVLLTEFVGMTYGEAAELLDAREATVRQWKSRGLQTLRSSMCVSPGDGASSPAQAYSLV